MVQRFEKIQRSCKFELFRLNEMGKGTRIAKIKDKILRKITTIPYI